MEKYNIFLHTSNRYLTSGTYCQVVLRLTGENGISTKWQQLGKSSWFSKNLERGSIEEYVIQHTGDYIGLPSVVTLKLSGRWLDSWLCDKVVIVYKEETYEFPVYDWVDENETTFLKGQATLPQKLTCDVERTFRKVEVGSNKTKFGWCTALEETDVRWGLSRSLNASNVLELPKIFLRTYEHMKTIGGSGLNVIYNAAVNVVRGFISSVKGLDDYRKLYKSLGHDDPCFIENWSTDEEMGRQVINGMSPLAFERCRNVPQYCCISDQDIKDLLPAGSTLQSEIEAQRLYIADYTYARHIERNKSSTTGEPFVCASCLALFRVTDSGSFLPIAIQLAPDDSESIFTPNDSEDDWLLAKIYFRSTMTVIHEWQHHFLYTHGVSETFCIATLRCFPRSHPLYKLLRPHLVTVPTINTDARFVIMPPKSLANRSISLESLSSLRYCYKTFHLSMLDIPDLLQRKGLDDPNVLPSYFYRDDALCIWSILIKYVSNLLRIYYKSDEDVKEDFELQAWAHDIAYEGFGWQDGNTRGMPEKIDTIDQLVHFCVIIIFTSSAQHAAVNFGQMEAHQFIPNSPGCMRLPIHKKGEATTQRIIASLPDIGTASIFISFSYSLSYFSNEEIYLGDIPDRMFTDEEAVKVQIEFRDDLRALNEKVQKRNQQLKYPYTYLLPEKIPISIAI